MKYSKSTVVFVIATLFGTSSALPVRREVPQEHSHQNIIDPVNTSLKVNNPNGIVDAIFGLLGNEAAAAGAGKITDANCLQQATADQAFTNAKAAGDINGQVAALTYRALERNTGSVGLASTPCTSITAVNPEIAALSQHQDPASPNAASINKGIALELAKQIQAVGGNPQLAILSGTFAPGKIGDPTAKGNTCDDANDANGCINTDNLLVPDVTADEINAAIAGGSSSAAAAPPVASSAAAASSASSSSSSAAAAAAPPASGALSFGTCTDPSVKFGAGLDGRKATEFSFIPNNQADFSHDSALNPDIIYQFICNTFVNVCGLTETDTTVTTCRAAETAADALGKTGASADSFNKALGITTDFAALDTAAAAATSTPAAAAAASSPAAAAAAAAPSANTAVAVPAAASGNVSPNGIDLGTCSNPTIEFGPGLDGRQETEFSFAAVNSADFDHGSALNSGVLTNFICLQFVNKCGLTSNSDTVTTCNAASTAASALGKVGAAADSFNAAFGFKTDFAAVNTNPAAASASSGAAAASSGSAAAASSGSAAAASSSSSGALNFGTCSNPTIKFAAGLDGRTETAFAPVNEANFNHGSADAIGIIATFICGQLQSSCKASAATVSTCNSAATAASALGKVGAAADSFNKALGFSTDFTAVKAIA